MTLAKGLANGVPIGACLARGPAAEVFQAGNHGSTFGGNPLACRAALTVLKVLEDGQFERRAAQSGKRILEGLQQNLAGTPGVKEIRGQGLMLAVELERPCKELLKTALEHGLLINIASDKIVRLLPPLIISEDEADQIVQILTNVVRVFLEQR
jgi:acetylornithine aminotransferase